MLKTMLKLSTMPTRAALILAALLSSAALAAADPPPPPAEESTTESAAEGETLPLLPEAEAPPVARDVGIEELPLLVTEPDEEIEAAPIPAPVLGGSDSGVNPFSPLLLPQAAPPTPPQSAPVPPTPPVVATPATPAPAAPPVAADPGPAAPLPAARTGTPPLPRSLTAKLRPTRTPAEGLSATVLGRALGTGTLPSALGPAAELAAVRAPTDPAPLVSRSGGGAQQVARGTGLAVMGLGGNEGNFTSSGSNRVSRALGTLQVSFTAMATGTGIFRVGDGPIPVLLEPGQTLPGTELVLTRLTDRGAQFAEDDVRHTLFLNP